MIKLNILLLLGCFLFLSCQSDIETESFINLEDEYELSISQSLSSNGGNAALDIKTSHQLECSNYKIPYDLDISQENIIVSLSKVTLDGDCIPASSYVHQEVDFGFEDNEKNITIFLQDVISNSGTIKVTDDEITMNLTSNDGLKINKVKINRIQKNMMWGTINNGTQSSVDKIKELMAVMDNGSDIALGDYGLFQVSNSDNLQITENAVSPIHSFVLYSDSKFDDIQTEIQSIKEIDPTLVFKLTLFDGQTINVL